MILTSLPTILLLFILQFYLFQCQDKLNVVETEQTISTKQFLTFEKQNKRLLSEENIESSPEKSQNLEYKRILTSEQYYKIFSEQISKISFSEVINVTHLSNGKEMCLNQKPCQFYYYVIKPKFDPEGFSSFEINKNNNMRNVAIVAGMHGNEYIGPMSLIYALKHLESPSTRIIIFPLANPSGFDHNSRLVYPTNVDPNRDFPIEQYKQCYQSTSSLIIDHIYRLYHIDLTLALHNGMSEIGWNWGTVRQKIKSHTVDEPIYRDIGEWLKFAGGSNKDIKMDEFKIGTMNQAVYPVKGAFEDWAYAASWYNVSIPTAPTKQCNYSHYPFNMTNGLVFLFELGPFIVDEKLFGSQEGIRVHPSSKQLSNGYLSRTIRMLSGLVKIPNPRLRLTFTSDHVIIRLEGCKTGNISNFIITQKQNQQVILSEKQNIQVVGNINNRTIEPYTLPLQKNFFSQKEKNHTQNQISKILIIEYILTCDSAWQGKGQTVFGKRREFKVKQSLILSSMNTPYHTQNLFPSQSTALQSSSYIDGNQDQEQSQTNQFVDRNKELIFMITILVLVIATMTCIIYTVCKQMRKDQKKRRIQRLKKQLQTVNKLGQQQLSEISLSGFTANLKPPGSSKTKKVESYPQLCESDKSMKTDQLEQVLQLQQFIKRFQNLNGQIEETT